MVKPQFNLLNSKNQNMVSVSLHTRCLKHNRNGKFRLATNIIFCYCKLINISSSVQKSPKGFRYDSYWKLENFNQLFSTTPV